MAENKQKAPTRGYFEYEQSSGQKHKWYKVVLLAVGIAGFFLIINSVGSIDGDYIVLSTQVSLNVKRCFTGIAMICMAMYVFKNLFK